MFSRIADQKRVTIFKYKQKHVSISGINCQQYCRAVYTTSFVTITFYEIGTIIFSELSTLDDGRPCFVNTFPAVNLTFTLFTQNFALTAC